MQVNKWIILKRAYLWIPSCVGCGAIAWNHLFCLCEDTFQEPDTSLASLNNVWHLPHCSVLFILHGVRFAGVVKCLPYQSATLVE